LIDGFVKSPSVRLRRIVLQLRRCSATVSAPHSSIFARLASGAFYETIVTVNFFEIMKVDDLVKSRKSRHSCESRSPELLELTGFPLSRE